MLRRMNVCAAILFIEGELHKGLCVERCILALQLRSVLFVQG